MSASRGYFPGSTIRTFIGILLIRSFFRRIFLLNGQQHDTCRRRKRHDHNSQQWETISRLREGLHLMRRRRRSRRRGCSGRRLRCGRRSRCGRVLAGCGFVYHLNEPFVSAHPFGIGIFADEQTNTFVCLLYLKLHRFGNFKASRSGIFGQGVDVLLAVVRQFEGIIRDGNTMRFVVSCPSVDDLIIFITDRQRSARQQITCNVRFVDVKYWRVLHDNSGIIESHFT